MKKLPPLQTSVDASHPYRVTGYLVPTTYLDNIQFRGYVSKQAVVEMCQEVGLEHPYTNACFQWEKTIIVIDGLEEVQPV